MGRTLSSWLAGMLRLWECGLSMVSIYTKTFFVMSSTQVCRVSSPLSPQTQVYNVREHLSTHMRACIYAQIAGPQTQVWEHPRRHMHACICTGSAVEWPSYIGASHTWKRDSTSSEEHVRIILVDVRKTIMTVVNATKRCSIQSWSMTFKIFFYYSDVVGEKSMYSCTCTAAFLLLHGIIYSLAIIQLTVVALLYRIAGRFQSQLRRSQSGDSLTKLYHGWTTWVCFIIPVAINRNGWWQTTLRYFPAIFTLHTQTLDSHRRATPQLRLWATECSPSNPKKEKEKVTGNDSSLVYIVYICSCSCYVAIMKHISITSWFWSGIDKTALLFIKEWEQFLQVQKIENRLESFLPVMRVVNYNNIWTVSCIHYA